MKIYICNAPSLTNRRLFMTEQLRQNRLSAELIMSEEEDLFPINQLKSAWYDKMHKAGYGRFDYRELRKTEKSVAVKHFVAASNLARYPNDERAIVLEDDVKMSEEFTKLIDGDDNLPYKYDMIFFGQATCISQYSLEDDGFLPVFPGTPASRTTDCYMMNRKAARCIVASLYTDGLTLPIDFELSYIINKYELRVAHLSKPLIVSNQFPSANQS